MRLMRNEQGAPPPLILHQRLWRVRALDRAARYWLCRLTGSEYRLPRYERASKTAAQRAAMHEACKSFLGSRSPNEHVARHYRERVRQTLLRNPRVSQAEKNALSERGAYSTPEDEAHVAAAAAAAD